MSNRSIRGVTFDAHLISFLTAAFPNYLRDLEALVSQECGTYDKAGVDAVGRRVREHMREFGAEVTEFPQEKYGNCLYGSWRGRGKSRIFMIGHLDTVYLPHRLAISLSPRRLARLWAGVEDMKSGLLNGLYAVHALVSSGFDAFGEIGLFCNSEEKSVHRSRAHYTRIRARARRPAGPGAGAREREHCERAQGRGPLRRVVRASGSCGRRTGKRGERHFALAQHIQALHALNGFRPGLTLNVGVIAGGTRPNVVAEAAQGESTCVIPA